MPKIYTVTIRLPGTDFDDCLHHTFSSYLYALEFAADCCERINKSVWHDCLCNTDGHVKEALDDFNGREMFAGRDDTLGCAYVAISTNFDRSTIRAYCDGIPGWYHVKD